MYTHTLQVAPASAPSARRSGRSPRGGRRAPRDLFIDVCVCIYSYIYIYIIYIYIHIQREREIDR